VVRGDFDKMENILDLYRINHTVISRSRLLAGNFPSAQMLCINCARKPTAQIKRKLVAKVKSFVNRGGWLITSDWSLEPYLTEGWPQNIEVVTTTRRQPNTTVLVSSSDRTSPLLEQVFARRSQTRWWLEEQSTLFRVKNKRTRVLVHSDELMTRYGARAVVIDFESGKGRVLHLLGHFWQKDGNRSGLVAMHRLILNYMQERFVPGG